MLKIFVKETKTNINNLKKLLVNKMSTADFVKFKNYAHKIKGSSISLCMTSIYNIAYSLEKIAKNEYIRRLPQDIKKVEKLIIMLEWQLEANLARYYEIRKELREEW